MDREFFGGVRASKPRPQPSDGRDPPSHWQRRVFECGTCGKSREVRRSQGKPQGAARLIRRLKRGRRRVLRQGRSSSCRP